MNPLVLAFAIICGVIVILPFLNFAIKALRG